MKTPTSNFKRQRFSPIDIAVPFQGFVDLVPSTQLPANASPRCENARISKGILQKRCGYNDYGTNAMSGTPMALVKFQIAAGTEKQVCLTTTNQYVYNSGSQQWDDITRIKSRVTFTALVVTGTFTNGETVTQATSGATGKFIARDGLSIYLEYISGTWDSTHTITGGTSGATATCNSTSTEFTLGAADPWTGTESANPIDWTIATGIDGLGNAVTWLIAANGLDMPRYWDGVASKFKNLNDAYGFLYPSFATAKSVKSFYNHLILIHPYVLADKPYTVVWSNVNSFVDWGFGSGGAGTSGEAILSDINSPLNTGVHLGDRLVLYADDSLTQMTHVGGDSVFVFDTLIRKTTVVSSRGIVDMGGFHLFVSTNNIKLFDGTRMLKNVGDRIFRGLEIGFQQIPSLAPKIFAFYDERRGRVHVCVPWSPSDVSGNTPQILVGEWDGLDISKMVWSVDPFNVRRITTLGETSQDSSPSLMFGFSTGRVSKSRGEEQATQFDESNGTQSRIDFRYDTIDFTAPVEHQSSLIIAEEIEFEARSTVTPATIKISSSVDEGVTLVSLGTQVLTADQWVKFKMNLYLTGRKIRFIFQNDTGGTNAQIFIRWIRPFFKIGAAY